MFSALYIINEYKKYLIIPALLAVGASFFLFMKNHYINLGSERAIQNMEKDACNELERSLNEKENISNELDDLNDIDSVLERNRLQRHED